MDERRIALIMVKEKIRAMQERIAKTENVDALDAYLELLDAYRKELKEIEK